MIESRVAHTCSAVALHYDELDHFYREIWGEHVHHGLWLRGDESSEVAVRQLVELVARQAEVSAGTDVCDAGCGYGATARMLASDFGAAVTAMTISPAQFKFATDTKNESGNPSYLLGDWLQNSLTNDSFDAIISVESSEHMPDKKRFFSQAYRLLRPGGRFVICAWLAKQGAARWEDRLLLEPICREGRMPGIGTEGDYRAFFEEAGFVVESYEDLSSRVKKTWPLCAWRFLASVVKKPSYLRFLLDPHSQNRVFALTVFRIWLAYNTGSLRYGIFTGRKAGDAPAS